MLLAACRTGLAVSVGPYWAYVWPSALVMSWALGVVCNWVGSWLTGLLVAALRQDSAAYAPRSRGGNDSLSVPQFSI